MPQGFGRAEGLGTAVRPVSPQPRLSWRGCAVDQSSTPRTGQNDHLPTEGEGWKVNY